MSAAPVTEAHYALRREVIFSAPDEGAQLIADSEAKAVGPHAHVAAQLAAVLTECGAPEFANSEHALQWAKGIAQLRAECNNLRAKSCQCAYDEACAHVLRAERAEAELKASRYETVKAAQAGLHECIRAERAEAELAGIRALANRRNKRDHSQDTTHQLVAALDQALDIAQAELAEQKWIKESAVKRAKELTQELAAANAKLLRNESDGYLCELERTRTELAAERARLDKVFEGWDSQCTAYQRISRSWANPTGSFRAAIDAAMKEDAKP